MGRTRAILHSFFPNIVIIPHSPTHSYSIHTHSHTNLHTLRHPNHSSPIHPFVFPNTHTSHPLIHTSLHPIHLFVLCFTHASSHTHHPSTHTQKPLLPLGFWRPKDGLWVVYCRYHCKVKRPEDPHPTVTKHLASFLCLETFLPPSVRNQVAPKSPNCCLLNHICSGSGLREQAYIQKLGPLFCHLVFLLIMQKHLLRTGLGYHIWLSLGGGILLEWLSRTGTPNFETWQ